jgi:hypothetical protein
MKAGCAVATLPFKKPCGSSTTAGAAHLPGKDESGMERPCNLMLLNAWYAAATVL